jgi:hypothetical protein
MIAWAIVVLSVYIRATPNQPVIRDRSSDLQQPALFRPGRQTLSGCGPTAEKQCWFDTAADLAGYHCGMSKGREQKPMQRVFDDLTAASQ